MKSLNKKQSTAVWKMRSALLPAVGLAVTVIAVAFVSGFATSMKSLNFSSKTSLSLKVFTHEWTKRNLKLVNIQFDKSTADYKVPASYLAKQNETTVIPISIREDLGPSICLCAASGDTWSGFVRSVSIYGFTLAGPDTFIKLSTNDVGYYPCWQFRVDGKENKLHDMGHTNQCSVKRLFTQHHKIFDVTLKTADVSGAASTDSLDLVNVKQFMYHERETLGQASSKSGGLVKREVEMTNSLGDMICICATGDDGWQGYLTELIAPRFEGARSDRVTLSGVSDVLIKVSEHGDGYFKCWRFDIDGHSSNELTLESLGGSDSCKVHDTPDGLSELASASESSSMKLLDYRKNMIDIGKGTKNISDGAKNAFDHKLQILGKMYQVFSQVKRVNIQGRSLRSIKYFDKQFGRTIKSFADAISRAEYTAGKAVQTMENLEDIRLDLLINSLDAKSIIDNLPDTCFGTSLEEDIIGSVVGAVKKTASSAVDIKKIVSPMIETALSPVWKEFKFICNYLSKFEDIGEVVHVLAENVSNLPAIIIQLAQQMSIITETIQNVARFSVQLRIQMKQSLDLIKHLAQRVMQQGKVIEYTQITTSSALKQLSDTSKKSIEKMEENDDKIAQISQQIAVLRGDNLDLKKRIEIQHREMTENEKTMDEKNKEMAKMAATIALLTKRIDALENQEKTTEQPESEDESNTDKSDQSGNSNRSGNGQKSANSQPSQ